MEAALSRGPSSSHVDMSGANDETIPCNQCRSWACSEPLHAAQAEANAASAKAAEGLAASARLQEVEGRPNIRLHMPIQQHDRNYPYRTL